MIRRKVVFVTYRLGTDQLDFTGDKNNEEIAKIIEEHIELPWCEKLIKISVVDA